MCFGQFFSQYSLFGSILTIGAMIGAIMSGRIADYIGRRGVSISPLICFTEFRLKFLISPNFDGCFVKQTMGFSQIFCILGWLAIGFSKVHLLKFVCLFSNFNGIFVLFDSNFSAC